MNIKEINLEQLFDLVNESYEFMVIEQCNEKLEELVEVITEVFKEYKVVSENFEFEEIYKLNNEDGTNLIIGLIDYKVNYLKLPLLNILFKLQGVKVRYLSDYLKYIESIELCKRSVKDNKNNIKI